MATPLTLSKPQAGLPEPAAAYSWQTQTRPGTVVGKYTSGSIQTYNSKGQPADSKSDQDD
jgi:hypothetical protein